MSGNLRLRELPPDEWPRERLARHGSSSLSDAEIIAIFLRSGVAGKNVVSFARELLDKFGGLAGLARCTVDDLCAVKGIGPAKAAQLAAAFSLGNRLARTYAERRALDHPEAIYELVGAEMQHLRQETLQIILLDVKLRLLKVERISVGSLTENIAQAREIFRPAFAHSAFAIVMVHNHPSGDPSPSNNDIRITRELQSAAELLGFHLADHVIIGRPAEGRDAYFSFREHDLLG